MVTYKEEFYAASYHKTKNPNDDIEAYIYIYIYYVLIVVMKQLALKQFLFYATCSAM